MKTLPDEDVPRRSFTQSQA